MGLGADEGEEDLGGDDEDVGGGEDLSGDPPGHDAAAAEPRFAVGQVVRVLKESGLYADCTIVAADQTEMGPMYAVRFEDGFVQSLVPEAELSV